MRELSELRRRLYDELPTLASDLIRGERYRNRHDPFRQAYAESPDDPLMHSPKWHQWGVLTHTRMVGRQFEETLPRKLEEWFGATESDTRLGLLEETVGDLSKWELLLTAVPTHDWGKFTVRGLARGGGSLPRFRFGGHEAESGVLVRERVEWFRAHGVSADQLEYIARCSELHFELGKVRDSARNQGGYNLSWVQGDRFPQVVDRLISRRGGFEREIGLFFLADNWGKTDLIDSVEFMSDKEVEKVRFQVRSQIENRGLPRDLIECALQLPTNTAVGRRYLEQIRALSES
jgi:hypothetical protein